MTTCELGKADCSYSGGMVVLGLAILFSLFSGCSLIYYQTKWFFIPRNSLSRRLYKQEDVVLYPHPEDEV